MRKFEKQKVRDRRKYWSVISLVTLSCGGTALAQTGHLHEAMAQFEAAIKLDPTYADAHYDLACALTETGHIPEAIEQFKAVLEIDPGDVKARNHLERLQAATNRVPGP